MTPKQFQATINIVKYIRDCIFSPGGALVILVGLGFIPFSAWTVIACFLVPALDGATKGIVLGMQNALDETIKEL